LKQELFNMLGLLIKLMPCLVQSWRSFVLKNVSIYIDIMSSSDTRQSDSWVRRSMFHTISQFFNASNTFCWKVVCSCMYYDVWWRTREKQNLCSPLLFLMLLQRLFS
jgi:hypothetical protein